MALGIAGLAALAAGVGCQREPLLTAAEEAALDGWLAQASRVKFDCRRPPLRGDPLPGDPADSVRAVLDRHGPHESCFDAYDEHKLRIDAAPGDADSAETRVASACQKLRAEVRRAVSYGVGCSPFGLADTSDLFAPTDHRSDALRLRNIARVQARVLAKAGRRVEAAEALLDLLRLTQDLERGATNLIDAMIAATRPPGELAAIVMSPDLEPAEAAVLHGQFVSLIASAVPPSQLGGQEEPSMMTSFRDRIARAREEKDHVEAEAFLASWLALEVIARERPRICPARASHRQCGDAWDRWETDHGGLARPETFGHVQSPRARDMAARALPMIVGRGKYHRKAADGLAYLLALELALRARAGGQPCPGDPLGAAVLGDHLVVETLDGEHRVLVPPWVHRNPNSPTELVRFRCPTSAEGN